VRSPSRFSVIIASGLLLLVVFSLLAFSASWWIPIVPPALAWFTSAMIVTAYMSNVERVQRGVLMQLFARHLSPEVAETIWQQRDEFLQGRRPKPQQITVTVLFTDLVNFTSVSEKKTPDALLAWLNEYMEQMSNKVSEHGGIINKYIGDSVMALFGAPLPRRSDSEIRNDAVNAVRCALHMARELLELNRQWEEQNLPMVGMRIGIFTGPVVVGSLGGTERLEYTVIGDTVNTASRLEGFNKELFAPDYRNNACRILVGETTQRYLGNEFEVERVGEVSLKGKEQKLTVYNIVAGITDSAGTVKEGR
jgi:adenylate cyclase